MTANPDLVIRGGTIADGRGGDLFEADVAIKDGRIAEVGKVAGKGKEEIDARGKLVAPGFRTVEQRVRVDAGKVRVLRFELQRTLTPPGRPK